MKKPRIKLFKKEGDIKVFIVDGAEIRKNLNNQFTNFGQHYRFDFIPVDEFWVDRCKGYDEYEFYIQNMLKEHELMGTGHNYDYAHKKGCEAEQELRNHRPKKDIKIGVVKKIGDVTIWLVDGEQVRNQYDIDFTEGGHDLVYRWIPEKEVWIDNDVPLDERDEIMLHECDEREKMEGGRKYIPAHRSASIVEQNYRKTKKMPRRFRDLIPIFNKIKRSK